MVITDMYTSPPVTPSTLLQQIVTRLLVSCIIKPAVPRLTIFFAYSTQLCSSFFCKSRAFISAFRSRKRSTYAADKNWESTVAIAAPLIPSPNTKINSGSRIRLATAPIATDSIPVVAYPCALINGFIPVAIIDGTVPIR